MDPTDEGLSYHSLRIKGEELLPVAYYHGGNIFGIWSACRIGAESNELFIGNRSLKWEKVRLVQKVLALSPPCRY